MKINKQIETVLLGYAEVDIHQTIQLKWLDLVD